VSWNQTLLICEFFGGPPGFAFSGTGESLVRSTDSVSVVLETDWLGSLSAHTVAVSPGEFIRQYISR